MQPWCPSSSCSQAAGQGIRAAFLSGFPLTDWQKQEVASLELLAQSLPLLLTLPAPARHLVATQNLTTGLNQVPTSAKILSSWGQL